MSKAKTEMMLLMLMGIIILLMVAILGLFIRMDQLQREVLVALEPFRGPQGLPVGTRAPAFALPDTTGRRVSLSDFSGERVLLAFSYTRCSVCVEMYPHLKTLSENHQDVQVIMISWGSAEENRQVVKEQGFGFPVLMGNDKVAQDYQVPGTPFFYVIDGKGIIANAGFASTLEQLEALVEGERR